MNVFLLLNERTCGRKHAPHMNPHWIPTDPCDADLRRADV